MPRHTTGMLEYLAAHKGSAIERVTAPPRDEELHQIYVLKDADGVIVEEVSPEQFDDMLRGSHIKKVEGSHACANARFNLKPRH